MFRGVLFYGASSSFGIWRAVWITAIIFGSVHMLNSLITGDFSASIFQAFFAGTFGICTAALRIRLNTIIPVIIIHWLWDCLAFLTNSIWDLALLPFSLMLFVYSIWLLRNYWRGEIEFLRDQYWSNNLLRDQLIDYLMAKLYTIFLLQIHKHVEWKGILGLFLTS